METLFFSCSTAHYTTLPSRKFFTPLVQLLRHLCPLPRPPTLTQPSDYSAKVFGFATFGKVYGLIICLAGLLNFSQSGLDALTHIAFANDPVPINVILLSLALLVGVALVLFVWRKSHRILRENIEEEAQDAREVMMPGANGIGVSDYGAINGNGMNGSGTVTPVDERRGRRL